MPFGFRRMRIQITTPSATHKRLLMVLNLDSAFLTHRLQVALAAKEAGYDVHIALNITDYETELKRHGFTIHPLELGRGLPSLRSEWKGFFGLFRLISQVKPHVVHLVTARPVLYGGIITRLMRIPTLSAIPGLGSAYLMKGMKGWCLRKTLAGFYRLAVSHSKCRVIVQNPDDEKMIKDGFGVPADRINLIPGSGADLTQYPCMPEPQGPIRVTLASRLLIDKGVREFLEAATIVHRSHPEVQFILAGALDLGNPTSLTTKDLDNIKQLKYIQIIGHQPHLAPLFCNSHIVVLPSYREGLPKVLIEAAACGRSVITTDVPGCRDAIRPNTGLLVPVKNALALAEAIKSLVLDADRRHQMGLSGRHLAEKEFDINIVIAAHLKNYQLLTQSNIVNSLPDKKSPISYTKFFFKSFKE